MLIPLFTGWNWVVILLVEVCTFPPNIIVFIGWCMCTLLFKWPAVEGYAGFHTGFSVWGGGGR